MKPRSLSVCSIPVHWFLPPALFLSLLLCSCAPFNVPSLTNDPYDDEYPQINASGQVVWQGCDSGWPSTCQGGDYEIYFWDGTAVTKITDNGYEDRYPRINDNGWIVWEAEPAADRESEIFLYDGTETIQLTDNANDDLLPQINNNGWVTWLACDGVSCTDREEPYRVFLYDGSATTQLTDNAYHYYSDVTEGPKLNNRGEVVWVERGDPDTEIFLYDGANTIQLSDNDDADTEPEINNSGQVVWRGGGIWLYDGSGSEEISHTGEDPHISDNGEVVWMDSAAADGNDTEIFLYDGTTTTQLTHNNDDDLNPQINASGEVVWARSHELIRTAMGSLYSDKIVLYDGMETTELATTYGSSFQSRAPKIGADGTVVWAGVYFFPEYGTDIYVVVP